MKCVFGNREHRALVCGHKDLSGGVWIRGQAADFTIFIFKTTITKELFIQRCSPLYVNVQVNTYIVASENVKLA